MPTSKSFRINLGITLGDPSGIGAEIIKGALKDMTVKKMANFFIIGDMCVLSEVGFSFKGINVIDLKKIEPKRFRFGRISPSYGKASIAYIDTALKLLKAKIIDALVTCPISKEAINLAGIRYPGHTEYLAEKTGICKIAMMLLNSYLKIVLVTRHIPINKISKSLTVEGIYETLLLTHKSLKRLFCILHPRIGVFSLNPHAGEAGLLGKEEKRLILPAIKKAKDASLAVWGPLDPASLIVKALNKEFDALVAMYHDQALIALKALEPQKGVNLTLGLPFVRTSPFHGTAFDIAGKGIADSTSLKEAISLAIKLTLNVKRRRIYS